MVFTGITAVVVFWFVAAALTAFVIYTIRRQRRVARELEKTQQALLGVTAELLVAEIKLRMYRLGKKTPQTAEGG